MAEPVRIFYSYSHADEALRKELETHLAVLKRQKLITGWHDRDIAAGERWDDEIKKELERADIVLLLVSPSFVASEYCWDHEMERAIQRQQEGTVRVIPVILRPVELKNVPFMKFQALPRDAKPVTSWRDRDEAWKAVATGIREVAEKILARKQQTDGAAAQGSSSSGAGSSPRKAPAPTSVHRLISAALLPHEFDALTLDYPQVRRRFAPGMEQGHKITILLEEVDPAEVLRRLEEDYPEKVAKYRSLLRFV